MKKPPIVNDDICFCPLSGILNVIAKKWALLIIAILGNGGEKGFNELKKDLGCISPKPLSDTLKNLNNRAREQESSGDLAADRKHRLRPMAGNCEHRSQCWSGSRNGAGRICRVPDTARNISRNKGNVRGKIKGVIPFSAFAYRLELLAVISPFAYRSSRISIAVFPSVIYSHRFPGE